jgi:hypothetical protein
VSVNHLTTTFGWVYVTHDEAKCSGFVCKKNRVYNAVLKCYPRIIFEGPRKIMTIPVSVSDFLIYIGGNIFST